MAGSRYKKSPDAQAQYCKLPFDPGLGEAVLNDDRNIAQIEQIKENLKRLLRRFQLTLARMVWQCGMRQKVIDKAKVACVNSGHDIGNHFSEVGKMVSLGSGSQRVIFIPNVCRLRKVLKRLIVKLSPKVRSYPNRQKHLVKNNFLKTGGLYFMRSAENAIFKWLIETITNICQYLAYIIK